MLRVPVEGSITLSFPIWENTSPQFFVPFSSTHFRCRGTYEPTNVIKNNFPVYVKQGDAAVTLECSTGKRWHIIAPIVNKKTVSDVLNIIARCDLVGDNLLPIQSKPAQWKFNRLEKFASYLACAELCVTATSKVLLPPPIYDLLSESDKCVSVEQ